MLRMNNLARTTALWLIVATVLQGCASLSEEECINADWTVIGEIDGQQGKGLSVLDSYRRDCADYGVVPNTREYIAGREYGLTFYCTRDNGYREGRSGARAEADCPAALAADFQQGYQLGLDVHNSLTNLRFSADTIREKRAEIDDLRSRRTREERSIEQDTLTDDQITAKRNEIADMSERIDDLQDEVAVSAAALAVALIQYRNAVGAAQLEGYYEPFEDELLREVQLFVQ